MRVGVPSRNSTVEHQSQGFGVGGGGRLYGELDRGRGDTGWDR